MGDKKRAILRLHYPLNGKNDSQYSKLQFIEHKNPDFVLETPENRGSEGQKRTKTSILCSKRPKMGVSEAKKAQKPRFCAREEGYWQWEEMILASGSATVAFLQITAHTSKMQIPHNQIINF